MAVWFSYNGGTAPASSPTSYTLVGSEPTCPSGTNRICAIFAENSGSDLPIITDGVKNSMINALNSRSDIPGAVLLKA